ncbi:hypothetical protein RHS04_08145 [Rhizoctonia solani]|uniref:Uncharacterized protein n=1 Tax=Rhizoctonia solani TaxID=456999 RepID=A0A8H7H0E6_9AGAM|nr:hypothetical protein RHS04_08145 [Rhizoctonia solani]
MDFKTTYALLLAIIVAQMTELLSTAHPARTEENGPEAQVGKYDLAYSSQGNSVLQNNRTASLESKFAQHTKITSRSDLYPKLAEACKTVDAIDCRQKETWRCLAKLGWTGDKISGLRNNNAFNSIWNEWVCWPKPPTNEDWNDIEFKLISLLEEDLAAHPKQNWKRAREQILSEEDRSIIKDLWKTDCTEQEMHKLFDAHRQTIEVAIVDWKRGIESHFASLVYMKRGSRAPGHTINPTLLQFESKCNPFANYTEKHQMLLQGDMLFYDAKKSSPLPIPITYGNILQQDGLIASPSSLEPLSMSFSPQADLNVYEFYLKAHLVARALMISMRIPKASYHLMAGLGGEFRCERCFDARKVTWVELIRHYLVANKAFKTNLKAFCLVGRNVMYRNVHNIDLPIKRPMAGFCLIDSPQELGGHAFKRHKCLLCTDIPGLKEVVAPEWVISRHLTDVHGVAEPAIHLHYNRQRIQEPVYDFGGYGFPPYDSAFI